MGSFKLGIQSTNAETFVHDSKVQQALKLSIASEAGVQEEKVRVKLSYENHEAYVRRAGASRAQSEGQADVQVDYAIAVDQANDTDASLVQTAMAGTSEEGFTDNFGSTLAVLDHATAESFPVQSVANSVEPPTVVDLAGEASAKGDPHLVNVRGQRFDLRQPGVHTMILIPRAAATDAALLRVVAFAVQHGGVCGDTYIQNLTISGGWTRHTREVSRHDRSVRYSASSVHHQGSGNATPWTGYGSVSLKVKWGRTAEGVRYLNLLVRNLQNAGHPVGGLLGDDDHTIESLSSGHCTQIMELFQRRVYGPV
jgi:hypothetical protein